jgi:hypothetical protein
MSKNLGNETFIGYAGLLFLAVILCFPMMGWSGIFSVLCMVYFGLVLTNGAGKAANRRSRR